MSTTDETRDVSLVEGATTKRLEGVVQRLMRWCDCGGEGCDLCLSAKAVTRAALDLARVTAERDAHAADLFRMLANKNHLEELLIAVYDSLRVTLDAGYEGVADRVSEVVAERDTLRARVQALETQLTFYMRPQM